MTRPRRLRVEHTTSYAYDRDVARSTHAGHLRPTHDRRQRVLDAKLRVVTEPHQPIDLIEYEDAFGNEAVRFELPQPYRRLSVTTGATVELAGDDPFDFRFAERPTVPLNWMPRERLALGHYLQAAELPDPQLVELFDYVMTFVRGHDGDLMESLFALNLALYREYEYVPGSTTLHTTAYETMTARRGVCQDFAGLMIMLARLIRVPARYVCGYIHTGNDDEMRAAGQRAGSDATHAWVELYLPGVGWRGFDPTNGVLPKDGHVRLAVGRNWRDAAPLTGTLFGDPAEETLDAAVSVRDVTDA